MTRINVGIHPKELPSKLLLAEHREIKTIPNCIKIGRFNFENIHNEFTLGKGHVSFFYNKIGYLKNRYNLIYDECIARGFNVTPYHSCFEDVHPKYMNDYVERDIDRLIIKERIESKNFKLIEIIC